jgi:hypothetical protein
MKQRKKKKKKGETWEAVGVVRKGVTLGTTLRKSQHVFEIVVWLKVLTGCALNNVKRCKKRGCQMIIKRKKERKNILTE